MKRSSKLLALLLAVLLVFGVVAVSVSAEEITLPSADGQLKPSDAKNVISNYDGSFTLSASSHMGNVKGYVQGVSVSKKTANGNDYAAIRWVAEGTYPNDTAGYLARSLGCSSTKVTANGLALNGELLSSYQVLDFDFTSDEYLYKTTVDGVDTYVTYTPEELLAAGLTPESEGVDRAIMEGDRFYNQVAGWNTWLADANTSSSRPLSTSTSIYFVKGTDGAWYYGDAKGISSCKVLIPIADVGEFDHITQVAVPYVKSETVTLGENTVNLVGVRVYTFINGQHLATMNYNPAGATSLGLEQLRLTFSGTMKKVDCYAYGIDNFTYNIYGIDYESTDDCYGLDDYFKDYGVNATHDITVCEDIVGSYKYITPNGYMQVKNPSGDRPFASFDSAVKAELAKIENNAVVETNIDLLDIDVPAGIESFTVKCDNAKVNVTLSEKSVQNQYLLKLTDEGYLIKKAGEEDLITLEWYDLKGDLYYTERVPFGTVPFTSNRFFAYFEGGKIYYSEDARWTWDLEGEIGALDVTLVSAGQTVKFTPSESEIKVIDNATYIMGYYNDDYSEFYLTPSSDGTYTSYANGTAQNVIADATAATYGDTCVLLADFTGLDGDSAELPASYSAGKIAAGKTVSLDLNGHKFSKHGIYNSDASPLFEVSDGATLNVYSSDPGGAFYFGHVRAVESRNNQTMSASGICDILSSAVNCEINIGALVDANGKAIFSGDNLTVNGGTLVMVNGSETTEDNSGAGERKINIRGGLYYYSVRGSYSFITIKGHDAKILLDGAKFYGTYSSASLVHEYDKCSTHGTEVTIKNTYSFSSRVFYRTSHGVYNIENSVLAGSLAQTEGGKFNIGSGVVFLSGFNSNLSKHLNDGVYYASPKTGNDEYDKFSYDFVHAGLYMGWASNFDYVLKDGQTLEDGILDNYTEVSKLQSVSFKESVYNDVTTHLSYNVVCVTFSEDELPEGVVQVSWVDMEGEALAYSYEFAGNTATPPVDVSEAGALDTEYSWCYSKYEWRNELTEDMIVSEDGCVFIPVETYVPLESLYMKANMSLSDSMVFNLYLVTPDGIEDDIEVTGAVSYGEEYIPALRGSMFIISVAEAIDSFATSTVTLSFSVSGYEISYEITVDSLKYVSQVAEKYECGSDEAILAYQIAEYKAAAAAYTGAEITEEEALRLDAFKALFDSHESCACATAYSEELLTKEELGVNFLEAFAGKVYSVSYLINSESIGIRVDVVNGAEVVAVSYVSVDGETKNANVKFVEDGYYVVSGISAADARAVMNVTVALDGDVTVGTYSLGAYTVSMGNDLAKALWSYSLAAYNYKVVLSTEK